METIKMTRREKEKMFQFVRLCSVLTKQGLKFVKYNDVKYTLVFDKVSEKQLRHPNTKTPFVNSVSYHPELGYYYFNQWADVYLKNL